MGTRPQNSQYTYPTVTVYGNPVATKKFPTESILKTIDSNVKNPGKVEYDKRNWPQHQKIQVRPQVVNHMIALSSYMSIWLQLGNC